MPLRFLSLFTGASGAGVTAGIKHAITFPESPFSVLFIFGRVWTSSWPSVSFMIEVTSSVEPKNNILGNKEFLDFLELYKTNIKQSILNDLKNDSFNESLNLINSTKGFVIKKNWYGFNNPSILSTILLYFFSRWSNCNSVVFFFSWS